MRFASPHHSQPVISCRCSERLDGPTVIPSRQTASLSPNRRTLSTKSPHYREQTGGSPKHPTSRPRPTCRGGVGSVLARAARRSHRSACRHISDDKSVTPQVRATWPWHDLLLSPDTMPDPKQLLITIRALYQSFKRNVEFNSARGIRGYSFPISDSYKKKCDQDAHETKSFIQGQNRNFTFDV
jgi:hypothetical protein